MKFSANLGYLWTELSLPNAVQAALQAGFDAVELHWPYETSPLSLRSALDKAALPVLSLNTLKGKAQEFGLAALPLRELEARSSIDQALAYAEQIGCMNIHILAGITDASGAAETFIANLRYAAERAAVCDIGILIEPLNIYDVPGYFLRDNAQAADIIAAVGQTNVRIMFDCYHVGRMGRPILAEFERYRGLIGHVQFASVPERIEPDTGIVDYRALLPQLVQCGYRGYLGAEYRPDTTTRAGLNWLSAWGLKCRFIK